MPDETPVAQELWAPLRSESDLNSRVITWFVCRGDEDHDTWFTSRKDAQERADALNLAVLQELCQ